MKRIIDFVVTGEDLVGLLRSGRRVYMVNSDCPSDAVFHSAYYDASRNSFLVRMQHPDFAPIPEGQIVPVWVGDIVVKEVES